MEKSKIIKKMQQTINVCRKEKPSSRSLKKGSVKSTFGP
jgi:ribosomal protein L1